VPYHVLTEARILEDTLPSGSDLSGERLAIMHPVDDETDFLDVRTLAISRVPAAAAVRNDGQCQWTLGKEHRYGLNESHHFVISS
jgi:hypothetical protein